MIYRHNQILVNLCNQCFQTYLWPTINFLGGLGIIGMLYVVMTSHHKIPISIIITIFVMVLICLFICWLMFEMGSKSIVYTARILIKVKKWNECKWSRRFFRSCPTIAFRLGEFHVMDRSRGLAFVKFILQRTFTLVVKTRISHQFGSTLTAFIPTVANVNVE